MLCIGRAPVSSYAILAGFMVGFLSPSLAQKTAPTADSVLARLQANIANYDESVPDFSCEEHIASQEIRKGKVVGNAQVVSAFYVIRSKPGSSQGPFEESRTIQTVNGLPSKKQSLKLPYRFNGGYANALDLVSAKNMGCYNDTLIDKPDSAGHPMMVLEITPKPNKDTNADCRMANQRGFTRARVDPDTMQILQLENSADDPHLKIPLPFTPSFLFSRHDRYDLSVDYAKVNLGAQSFWLPQTIQSTITDTEAPDSLVYKATYSNCHRFLHPSKAVAVSRQQK